MYRLLVGVPKQSLNKHVFSVKGRPRRIRTSLGTGRRNINESLSAPKGLKISRRTYKSQNFIFIKRVSPGRRRKGIIKKSF